MAKRSVKAPARDFSIEAEEAEGARDEQAAVIENSMFAKNRNPFDPDNRLYEPDTSYKPWKEGADPRTIHTVTDLVRYLESDKNAEIRAKVFCIEGSRGKRVARLKPMVKEQFIKACKSRKQTFKESIDLFSMDLDSGGGSAIGDDSLPLIGGPFTKQLYYTDYIKQHQACYYAYHHDPIARRLVNIVKQFTLGRGYSVDCDNKAALALWEAFAEANNLQRQLGQLARELDVYGEIMLHWLPNKQRFFSTGDFTADKAIPLGILPRVRLIDPSTIWEIITEPTDITRVLAYQQIFPTQWQMYTAKGDDGKNVPTTRFIYQQLPGPDVFHYRINEMSNEKRGRSELFAILSYLKRIRDLANYALVREMKDSAWCMDTTVKGNGTDLANYLKSQDDLGALPPAGSEFAHTDKIERKYLGAEGHARSASNIWDWAVSMACIGKGVPVSYLGSHLHGGSTRATAIVATEPVAKLFEDRQNDYENILQNVSQRLFKWAGVKARLEFTFPDLLTQDRSAKLKDLALARSESWLSTRRCAEIAARELQVSDFDYATEKAEIDAEGPPPSFADPAVSSPLTNPTSGLTGGERSQVKTDDRM